MTDVVDVSDEFTITGDGTIANIGGTDRIGTVLVLWMSIH